MIKVFNCPFRVTQKYGVNPDYYKKFGLDGHEGLDLVPTCSDWTVFSLPFRGVVVKDIDMGDKGGTYGIHGTIWYPDIKEAWMYCHLSSNRIYEGQEISPSSPIGAMGDTGNTDGAHLHVNRFKVDERGYRQDKQNGFLGGIDPLPFLQQDLGQKIEDTQEDSHKTKGIALLEEYRSQRKQGPEGNWESFARSVIESDRSINGVIGQISELQKEIVQQEKSCAEEKAAIRKEVEKANSTALKEKDKYWQSKLKSAKKSSLSEYRLSDLFMAILGKIT